MASLPARFCSDMATAMILRAPEKSPEDPRPAMARPTIKDLEFGAEPQIKDPNSKKNRKTRNAHYYGQNWVRRVARRDELSWSIANISCQSMAEMNMWPTDKHYRTSQHRRLS